MKVGVVPINTGVYLRNGMLIEFAPLLEELGFESVWTFEHVIVPDADGWIEVDPNALGNGFNGPLLSFDTTQPFPGGNANPGVDAGTPVPAANQREGVDVALVFEASRIPPAGPASPADHTNALSRIHINNWDEVGLLDLLQFHTGGGSPCSELTTDLDIEYTADHELMASWSIGVASSGTFSTGVLPSGTDTRPVTVAGTHSENITTWSPCSYRVTLSTRRKLTDGITDDNARTILKTFCKG